MTDLSTNRVKKLFLWAFSRLTGCDYKKSTKTKNVQIGQLYARVKEYFTLLLPQRANTLQKLCFYLELPMMVTRTLI